MEPDRWKRLWDLFHEAKELSEDRRPAYLEQQCADDPPLAREVLELLDSHDSTGGDFLRDTPRLENTPDLSAGDRVGPYRVLELLGSGGMGVVYLVEQDQPVQRKVALKLLRVGLDSGEFLTRFEIERQALARMSHAGIAQVFDAGVTESGRPYLAMEYVAGLPIQRYADERKMSTDERLQLFVRVCDAVQHAHRRGVIHRDLKPSNILVTEDDGRAVPKIIDFGVAKAIDRPLTDAMHETRLGRMIGTPAYMSPEQAGLAEGDIDLRTDVYSLGVVLYELLSGAHPFDAESLRRAGYDEIRRIIREEEPPRPSTRVETFDGDSVAVAQRRSTDRSTLARTIRGDLDWITMKALEKERDRRYDSPRELARDLRNYRNDLPVVARPPSARYRAGKFVSRHKLAVAATGVVLAGLVVGISVGAWGLGRALGAEREARSEAAAAERISEFMVSLFRQSDPSEARGREVTAREVLDAGVERIETELADDPVVRARLLGTMGGVYRGLGNYERALELQQAGMQVLQQLHGTDHPDTLKATENVAITYWYLQRFDQAESLLRQVADGRTALYGTDHSDTLNAMYNLAILMRALGRYEEGESLYRTVLESRRRLLGDEHLHTLSTMTSLANLLTSVGQFAEAEQLQAEALSTVERAHGADHPTATAIRNNLAVVYKTLERMDDALRLYRDNLEVQRRVLGDEHDETLRTINSIGEILIAERRYDEAGPLLEQNATTTARVLGDANHESLRALELAIQVSWETGREEQSRERVRRLIGLHRERLESMPDNANFSYDLANLLLTCRPPDLRDPQEALALASQAVDADSSNPYFLETLAAAFHETGQERPAVDTLKLAIELTGEDAGPFRERLEQRLAEYD
jgi:serine/threonine protein kinase